jgi:hypothetical protein
MNVKELTTLIEAQAETIKALTARIEALEQAAAKPAPKQVAAPKAPFVRKADPEAATYWAPHGRPPTHRRQF